jgi:hypothetical protein
MMATGRMDVFVANDTVRNFLFHNEGNGTFSEVGLAAGIAFNADGRALSSMGEVFRDVDNDGKPDLLSRLSPPGRWPCTRTSAGVSSRMRRTPADWRF